MFARMGSAFGRMGLVVTGHGIAGGGSIPPSAPVLSLVSESAGLITLNWDIDNTVSAGDSLHRQAQVSGGSWASLVDDTTHTITSGEDAANDISGDQLTLGNGTYDIRGFVIRASDGAVSASSNILTLTVSDAGSSLPSGAIIFNSNAIVFNSNNLTWV